MHAAEPGKPGTCMGLNGDRDYGWLQQQVEA